MKSSSALIGLHISVFLAGLTGIFGKLIDTGPVNLVFGRTVLAVLVLYVFYRFVLRHRWPRQTWQMRGRLVLGGLLLSAHWISFFIAVKSAGVAIATLGFAAFPAFTVLLEGIFYHEQASRREWLLIVTVSIGLILITPEFNFSSQATTGLLWAIVSGFLFSALSVNSRSYVGKVEPAQTACWQNFIVALSLLPFAAFSIAQVRALDWFWIALLGVLCTAISHTLFVRSLSAVKVRTAALAYTLEPIYSIALAWLIFAETPTFGMWVGGFLIVAAIVMSSLQKTARLD